MGLLKQQHHHQLLLFLLFPSLAMLKCCANVLRINTASDLARFSQSVNTGTNYLGTTVFLDSDIDFTRGLSKQFDPIGRVSNNYFFGSFDGQGHIISNLVINASSSSSQYGGLFGYSEGLTIKNVVIDSSCSVVSYCQDINNINIGGIIGKCESDNRHCIIENNVNMATVAFGVDDGMFNIYLGGIVGYVYLSEYDSFVKNCANYGSITHYGKGSNSYLGGIVGCTESSISSSSLAYIQNSFNYGNISHIGQSNYLQIGGINGFSSYVNIENCVSVGMISCNSTGQLIYIGSICGYVFSYASISHCYWSESIGYNAFSNTFGPEISETTSFNKNFVFNKTISAGIYKGNSLVEALNAYSSYYSPLEYSHWVLNKNESEKNISFTINNRSSPFTLNSQILLLPSLANDGRLLFDGWYTDKNCKTLLTDCVIDDTVTELYGKWEENNNYYTVTLNTRGGTFVEPITEEYLSVVTLPDNLVKSGCTIAFWEDEDGNKMEWNFTVPAHNITLYAVWKCTHIATADDLIDLSKCVSDNLTYKGTTVLLVSDIDFGGGPSQKFKPIGVNSLFLGTFDGQGHAIRNLEVNSSLQHVGLFGFYRGPAIKNVVIDASCSFVSLYSSGMHVFMGGLVGHYYADVEPSCVENNVNMANITFSGDIRGFNLYLGGIIGHLNPYSIGLTVRNCANYGSLVNSGKEDYLYIGGIVGYSEHWSHVVYIQNALNYGAMTHDGTVSTTVCIGGIMGYSGKYSNIENCVSAGDIASSEPNSYIGSIVGHAKSSATNISHCFWTDNVEFNASGSGEPTMDSKTSQAVLGTDLVNVLNKYSGPNEWSRWLLNANRAAVTFVVNYGNGNYVIKSPIMVLPDPADNGDRAFSGWYNDEDLRTPFTASGVEVDTTVYGVFCAPNYTVTLDVNGGDELEAKEVIVECNGTYVVLPDPTRTGHTFRGWFTESVGGRKVKSGDRVTNLNNHTLYAHWTINEYTLTIDYGNGTTVEETLEFNAVITYSEPTRKGYRFAGWSENITHMPARNITIVAMWKKSSSAQTPYILGVSITVSIVIIIVIIGVLYMVLKKKRKENGGYKHIETGNEIGKPLALCGSGDDESIHEYCRVVTTLVDLENDVVTGYTSVLTDLYSDEYTRPTMKEALLATDLTEEQIELVCESCENVARKAIVANTPPEWFTEEDAAAIAMYTYEFGPEYFDDNPYRIINKSLASRKSKNLQKAKGLLYLVMAAVRKLPRVTGKTLYRGVRSGVSLDEGRYRRGNVITWMALSSASPDMETTKAFLARGTKSGVARGTLFIIEGGWGYDIQPYSMFPTETEILLEPERRFKVISVIRTEGMTIVNLQMLETPLSLQHVFGYGMN